MNDISTRESLGYRIEHRRKEMKMTLKQLSEETGISAGFLSKIENDVCNPSIGNVQKICVALQMTVNELTAVKKEDELMSTIHKGHSYVLRKDERCLIYGFGNTFKLETVFEGSPSFKVNVMTLSQTHSEQSHCIQAYNNFVIVASGMMESSWDNGTKYELSPGDCVMVCAKQQYSIRNLSNEDCVSYWIEIKE